MCVQLENARSICRKQQLKPKIVHDLNEISANALLKIMFSYIWARLYVIVGLTNKT